MPRERNESPLSDAARELRTMTRLMVMLAAVLLVASFAAAKSWISPELGAVVLPLFVASALGAVWFGIRTHQRALADREMQSGRAMIVAIAAQLARQDDDALERIKARGGPAGEAAGMILEGRAEKAKRSEK